MKQAPDSFKKQLINLTERMTLSELENYIENLELSAIQFSELAANNATATQAAA